MDFLDIIANVDEKEIKQLQLYVDCIDLLNSQGIVILKNYANKDLLNQLNDEFDRACTNSKKLKQNDNAFTTVKEPFVNCPATVTLVMDSFIHDIVRGYLGKVKIGTCNLRQSHKHAGGPVTTEMFHCDQNCGKGVSLLKAFFYLNDVDTPDDGPFEYAPGSHKNRKLGWDREYRMPDKWVYDNYQTEVLTAKMGDVIVCDTSGFHRGRQVINKSRRMFTVNFVPGPEKESKFQIRRKDVPENMLKVVEYLELV